MICLKMAVQLIMKNSKLWICNLFVKGRTANIVRPYIIWRCYYVKLEKVLRIGYYG